MASVNDDDDSKMIPKGRLIVCLVVLLLILGTSRFAAAQQPQNTGFENLPPQVAAGARIFRAHCAVCHGGRGTGGRGPDLTTGEFRRGSSDEALGRTIRRGIRGTEMPGAYYSRLQLLQIIAYVRWLGRDRQPVQLPGDSLRGGELFRGAGGCLQCHRINGSGGRFGGDLTDIGRLRAPEHLRLSLLDPSAEILPAYRIVRAVEDDGGQRYGFLLDNGSFSLRLLDTEGNLHSLSKDNVREIVYDEESWMPSYREVLNDSQVDDLVAYLSSLRRAPRP